MRTLAASMTVLALLAGCAQAPSKSSASLPPVVTTDTTMRPRAMDAAPVSRGSLVPTSMIQSPSHRGLFEDRRPPSVVEYLATGCIPGGTLRNFDSYGARISALTDDQKHLLCDPQTSGGLLVAVTPEGDADFRAVAEAAGLSLQPIGRLVAQQAQAVVVR